MSKAFQHNLGTYETIEIVNSAFTTNGLLIYLWSPIALQISVICVAHKSPQHWGSGAGALLRLCYLFAEISAT